MAQMIVKAELSRVDENGVPHYAVFMWQKSDGTNVAGARIRPVTR